MSRRWRLASTPTCGSRSSTSQRTQDIVHPCKFHIPLAVLRVIYNVPSAYSHLRFVCQKPSVTIYTADFMISSSGGTSGPAPNKAANARPSASPPGMGPGIVAAPRTSTPILSTPVGVAAAHATTPAPRMLPLLTISLPNTTVTLIPTPADLYSVANSLRTPSSTSRTPAPTGPLGPETNLAPSEHDSNSSRRNMESLFKFRVFSVVWPFLVGVLLAL